MSWRAWGWWAATRALAFVIWALVAVNQNDVRYYHTSLTSFATNGPGATLVEYPTPVIWLLQLPHLVGFGSQTGFTIAFVLILVAIDVAIAWHLWRRGQEQALLFWTFALALMLPTAYLRLDLITTALAAAALFALAGGATRAAAGLTAVGAALKLWPALLWPSLLVANRRRNWITTAWFWAFGALLALTALLWGGWARLFSPLTWQADRGLQVESVWASVPMLDRAFRPEAFTVELSKHQAFEIQGPGVSTWLVASNVATALGLAIIVAAYVVWLLADHKGVAQAALLMTFVIAVTIVTNKTFSPQYLLWLIGPITAGLALARDVQTLRAMRGAAVGTLVLLALTLIVYPIGYEALLRPDAQPALVALALVVRNLGLVVLTVWLGHQLWGLLRAQREPRATIGT